MAHTLPRSSRGSVNLFSLYHFLAAKVRWRTLQGPALKQYQDTKARALVAWVNQKAPFYKTHWQGHSLEDWQNLPILGKPQMMEHFGEFNTLGIHLEQALEQARQAEQGIASGIASSITTGLSSGTSGQRGLFLVSPQEQAWWAGVILSRLLQEVKSQRIAFFLRANSKLYQSVKQRLLQFRYFDLVLSDTTVEELNAFGPSILVAPPSVLEFLANHPKLRIRPSQVVSVAEVLEEHDKTHLESAFDQPLHQVYQATEGLLAITCKYGRLHLQEDLVAMQMEALPGGRVTPIITDLWRKTQPIIRYRLGDVFQLDTQTCKCGSSWRTIAVHEGRLKDRLQFGDQFLYLSDVAKIMAQSPTDSDYVWQQTPQQLLVWVQHPTENLKAYLTQTLKDRFGLDAPSQIELKQGLPDRPAYVKRRRVQVL
jgi:putative adenylate-forming enzyme